MNRVLIFGGSFDPPHTGHRRLLAAALKTLRPDQTYLIPAWRSPLKAEHQASPEDRRRMAELLATSVSDKRGAVRVDRFELARGKTTFTYQVLRRFRAMHSDAELWFLAGSDAFAMLDRWKRPKEVRKAHPGAVVYGSTDSRGEGIRSWIIFGERLYFPCKAISASCWTLAMVMPSRCSMARGWAVSSTSMTGRSPTLRVCTLAFRWTVGFEYPGSGVQIQPK